MRLQLVITVIAICLLAIIGALFHNSDAINELTGGVASIPCTMANSVSLLDVLPAVLFLAVILAVYCAFDCHKK